MLEISGRFQVKEPRGIKFLLWVTGWLDPDGSLSFGLFCWCVFRPPFYLLHENGVDGTP